MKSLLKRHEGKHISLSMSRSAPICNEEVENWNVWKIDISKRGFMKNEAETTRDEVEYPETREDELGLLNESSLMIEEKSQTGASDKEIALQLLAKRLIMEHRSNKAKC